MRHALARYATHVATSLRDFEYIYICIHNADIGSYKGNRYRGGTEEVGTGTEGQTGGEDSRK